MTAAFAELLRDQAIEDKVQKVLKSYQPRRYEPPEAGRNPYVLTVSAGLVLAGLTLAQTTGTIHLEKLLEIFGR